MSSSIVPILVHIRRRQRLVSALRGAAYGLLASAVVALVLGIQRTAGQDGVTAIATIEGLLAGPGFGAILGLILRRPIHDAATEADRTAGLKDRATSALEFLTSAKTDVLHALQIDDAERHLRGVDPKRVVPLRSPRSLPYAAALLAAGIALLVWPLAGKSPTAQAQETNPAIQQEGENLKEDLKELEQFARENQDPELEKIAQELEQQADALQEAGVELKDALATISEMQAALAAYQSQFNLAALDAEFQALGEAMMPATPLQPAGEALKKGDYDKAANDLEKLQNLNLDRKEAKAAGEKMKRVSAQMIEAGQGELAESVDEIVEGMSECDKEGMCKGAGKLAKAARGQGNKKKISKYIVKELDELSECKSRCKSDSMVKYKGKQKQKSTEPSSNWGLTTSGNTQGDKTSLDANRDEDKITGMIGDEGATEIETQHSPEGRQDAQRSYAEKYREYKKMSDAVLDSEPIPLGHRALIRRYFELIRPQNPDTPATPGKND